MASQSLKELYARFPFLTQANEALAKGQLAEWRAGLSPTEKELYKQEIANMRQLLISADGDVTKVFNKLFGG